MDLRRRQLALMVIFLMCLMWIVLARPTLLAARQTGGGGAPSGTCTATASAGQPLMMPDPIIPNKSITFNLLLTVSKPESIMDTFNFAIQPMMLVRGGGGGDLTLVPLGFVALASPLGGSGAQIGNHGKSVTFPGNAAKSLQQNVRINTANTVGGNYLFTFSDQTHKLYVADLLMAGQFSLDRGIMHLVAMVAAQTKIDVYEIDFSGNVPRLVRQRGWDDALTGILLFEKKTGPLMPTRAASLRKLLTEKLAAHLSQGVHYLLFVAPTQNGTTINCCLVRMDKP